MRFQLALLTVATLVAGLASGCSRQQDAGFKEYVDDSPKTSPAPASFREKDAGKQSAVATSQGPALPDGDVSDQIASVFPAALGITGPAVLSEAFRLSPDLWLTPAVGPAAALCVLSQVNAQGKVAGSNVAAKSAAPREIKVLVKSKDFRVEGPDGAVRVSYDDIDLLKVINMDPVTPDAPKHMPKWLRELDGKRIRIRGFMSPAFKQTGLEGFLMGRDNKACCFPGRAKIYDLFPVRLRKGHTTHYIQNRPFDVVGTFQIKPWIEDGEMLRLYQIVDAVVVQ